MVAEAAKTAAMDYMTKWDPSWRLSQADRASLLQKGEQLVYRGMETTSELLNSGLDKLSGPWRYFYTHVFDQAPSTQLYRCLLMTFGIQMIGGFLPHLLLGAERHYYLLGGLNFLLVTAFTFFTQPDWGLRKVIVSAMVSVWAARLSTYLFTRSRNYLDKRFAAIRGRPVAKFVYWLGQALWVSCCMLPIIFLNSNDTPRSAFTLPGRGLPSEINTPAGTLHLPAWLGAIRGPARRGAWGTWSAHNLTWLDYTGFALWGVGFALECIADWQKSRFYAQRGAKNNVNIPLNDNNNNINNNIERSRSHSNNQHQQHSGNNQAARAAEDKPFIKTGLWRFSRHPNYLGEILMWCGIYLSCLNVLHGWQHIAILSPLMAMFTIFAVSGIPLHEDSKERQFGQLPEYQQYKKTTALIAPFVF